MSPRCVAALVCCAVLTGCAPVLRPGVYEIPAHRLVVADWDTVIREYRVRSNGTNPQLIPYGFQDGSELWCVTTSIEDCYVHEVKHLIGYWMPNHRIAAPR